MATRTLLVALAAVMLPVGVHGDDEEQWFTCSEPAGLCGEYLYADEQGREQGRIACRNAPPGRGDYVGEGRRCESLGFGDAVVCEVQLQNPPAALIIYKAPGVGTDDCSDVNPNQ